MQLPIGYYNLYTLLNSEVVKREEKKKRDITIIHVNVDRIAQVPRTGHTNYMYRDRAAQRSSLKPLVTLKEEEYISTSSKFFPLVGGRGWGKSRRGAGY